MAGTIVAATLLTTALVGAPLWLSLMLVAALALPLAALWRWRRMTAETVRPLVVLARFRSENPPFDEIANDHVKQIERRLRRNEALMRSVDLLVETIPMNKGQARRIMERSGVIAVASGSGLRVADNARWDGWMLVRWPSVKGRLTVEESTGQTGIRDEELDVTAPEHSPLSVDAQQDIGILTADLLDASHAHAVEAALRLAGAEWSDNDLHAVAEEFDENIELPLAVTARFAILRARVACEQNGDPLAAAQKLEAAGTHANYPSLWEWAQSLYMQALPSDRASAGMIRTARHCLALDAENLVSHANLAFQLQATGQPEEARAHFEHALKIVRPDDAANIMPALVSQLFLLGGNDAQWALWKHHFARVLAEDQPGVLAQLELTTEQTSAATPPDHFGNYGPFASARRLADSDKDAPRE